MSREILSATSFDWGFSFEYHTQNLSQEWSWLENQIIEINTKITETIYTPF
jgi:hypothetical protein